MNSALAIKEFIFYFIGSGEYAQLHKLARTLVAVSNEISNTVVCANSKSVRPDCGLRVVWSKPMLVAWIFYEC